MLDKILGGLMDTEGATRDIITEALERFSKELNVEYNQVLIMIRAKDEQFEPSYLLYKLVNKDKAPVFVRFVSLKEILNKE